MAVSRVVGVCLVLAFVIGAPTVHAQRKGGAVPVKGHYRKDGTYVQPHYRSAPDGNAANNWSTEGNVNPYTGVYGTKPLIAPPSNAAAPGVSPSPENLPPSSTLGVSPAPPAANPQDSIGVVTAHSTPEPGSPALQVKTAVLESPSKLSTRKGWQIRFSNPIGSVVDELRLVGTRSIACNTASLHSQCRPVSRAFPLQREEITTERATFFGAVNRVSLRLEIWGYPSFSDCERERRYIELVAKNDYYGPSTCVVIGVSDLGGVPPDTAELPTRPKAKTQPRTGVAAGDDDDALVSRLAAQQDKHVRVCGVIQKLGSRIDGLTKHEAAAIIAESVPGFDESDFTQIAVRFGVVRCFEPHTRGMDNCTLGSILRFRKGRCR